MLKLVASASVAGFLALAASSAQACVAPTEYPYDPTEFPADLVIEGVATSRGQSEDKPYADLRVSDVHIGKYAPGSFRLKWWRGGGGMCDPPGPDVRVGQKVRIYLTKEGRELRPLGWVLTNEMPKSLRQIQADQAIALEKAARQEKYFPVGGALSFNDPKKWLKIEDIPELRGSPGMVFVSFLVSSTGKMENCTPGHVAKYVSLDEKACKIIERRARLVPPKFPEEASGSFEMYPPEFGEPTISETQSRSTKRDIDPTMMAILLTLLAAIAGLLIWWFKRGKTQA